MPPKTLRLDQLDGPLTLVTGTRPGIVKFSPLLRELVRRRVPHELIHSGQHYSSDMDAVFFVDLDLEPPKYRLDVVRHYPLHGEQTAEMLKGIEKILLESRPQLILVGGDCNTHLAGALAARKLHIPIGHVEAGMRSYDWRMPEEHNRVMIDHISEHLFVHNEQAASVLRGENVRGETHIVGTTIVDALTENRLIARERSRILHDLSVESGRYIVVTVHREENVDDERNLGRLLDSVANACDEAGLKAVIPLHPRTKKRMGDLGLNMGEWPHLEFCAPLGYLDFVRLLDGAAVVVTDSGGVQQEACILRVPCVTVRKSTEWTETVAIGANRLSEPGRALSDSILVAQASDRSWPNPFEAGAAGRLIDAVEDILSRESVVA